MRRIVGCSVVRGVSRASARCCGSKAAKEAFDAAEREQSEKEAAVDQRKVIFAAGSSAESKPRAAAEEAFDVAASALPRPPNFCMVFVSTDFSSMVEAPETVWFNMCKLNGVTPSTVKNEVKMIGQAVTQQRIGGGFIQVLLGNIPDLDMDIFTFDAIPDAQQLQQSTAAPPFACVAAIDSKLALGHEALLNGHLDKLKRSLGEVPLLGAVLPPATAENAAGGLDDSISFFNDRVFKGSAAGAVLRSRHVKALTASVMPSIGVGSAVVSGLTLNESGGCVIRELDGKKATERIREVYEGELKDRPTAKVFIAIPTDSGNMKAVPVTFVGNPDSGEVSFLVPPGVKVAERQQVHFVCDDVELDTETSAALLLKHSRTLENLIVSARKDVTIAREGRRFVTTSTGCAFHFSHPRMNLIAHHDDFANIKFSSTPEFVPPISQRCLGQEFATTGAYTIGQVVETPTGGAVMSARASTYGLFYGTD